MTLDSYAAFAQSTVPLNALTLDDSGLGATLYNSPLDLEAESVDPGDTSTINYTDAGTTLLSPAATTSNSVLDSISGLITGLAGSAGTALNQSLTGTPSATAVKPATVVAGLSLTEWALILGGGGLLLYFVMRK